jgi:hypothetical protein
MVLDLRLTPGPPALTLPTPIDHALARLDAWLDTLRGPSGLPTATCTPAGLGGPVAHWWCSSLLYTGPGFDWRCQGLILGYLALWERTGRPSWLDKAHQFGDELVAAQLPDGHYPASAFELNPACGGTPHEAAIDLALLSLAAALRSAGDPGWPAYRSAAVTNLRQYYLEKLWDPQARLFRDHPQIASFVPNKAATACQAFFSWSTLDGDLRWAEGYARPNLEHILDYQVTAPGPLHGAILQNTFNGRLVPTYMPYYIARCVPALVQGYAWFGQERFFQAAWDALDFVLRQQDRFDGLPPALYPGPQVNRWPRWRAGLGDVLLAGEALRPYGFTPDLSELLAFLLAGQDETGGIQTAVGFGAQTGGAPPDLPDFRDLLHVAGWCDKAFHALAPYASPAGLPSAVSGRLQADCLFAGRRLRFYEDAERLQAACAGKTVYLWIKGEPWAREAAPEFWLH